MPDNSMVIVRPFNVGATDDILSGKGVGKSFNIHGKSSRLLAIIDSCLKNETLKVPTA